MDIDLDIEKRIAQLQESRLEGNLEKKIDLSIDPDKQLNEWQFEKNFENFLENVDREKEVVERNIEEEEKKIKGLESLFEDLMAATDGKKKKKLLKEPEKVKPVVEEVKQVILKKPEKLDLTKTKEQIEAKYIKPLKKEETFIDEEARKVVAEKYGQLGHAALHTFLSPKDIEADPEMVDKVLQHISEMKVANELDKDKMKSLKSIDSLDKLTKEFLNFKNLTSVQLSTVGGGLDTNKISADLMPTTGSTYDLGSADRPWRKLYLSGGTLVVGDAEISGSEIAQLDGITAGTVQIQNSFKFEGATADAHETTLTTIDPTADRTISLPNATGTIVLQDTSDTLTNKSIDSDNNTITNIVNADIKAAAAISFSKMENLTVSRALSDEIDVSVSAVTSTEIGYLDGVTGNIQTQIDANTTLANTKASKAFAIAQAVALG